MEQIGVYRIDVGPYYYYGSSTRISSRRSVHRGTLQRNRHHNIKMQMVYNKHMEFKFTVVEECEKHNLRIVEQRFIDQYCQDRFCMNLKAEVDHNPGGHNAQKILWNGAWHKSKADAVQTSKLGRHSVLKYAAKGLHSDNEVLEYRRIENEKRAEAKSLPIRGKRFCKLKYHYNGRWWSSMMDLAKATNHGSAYLQKIMSMGLYSDDEAKSVKFKIRKPMADWNRPTALLRNPCVVITTSTKAFPSTAAACKQHKKCRRSVMRAIAKRGYYKTKEIKIIKITKEQYHEFIAADPI
jgi:hypothetical protein